MTRGEGTQSVLDEMVLGAHAPKVEASLTPVGTEKGGPLDGRHETVFPFDDPQTVRAAIKQGLELMSKMQVELKHVGDGLIALAALYGLSEDAPAPVVRKADERHAGTDIASQAKFEAAMAAKAEAAQAATFTDAPAEFKPFAEPAPEAAVGDGWECTEHGSESLVVLTSRKGRKYRACTASDCAQFEK